MSPSSEPSVAKSIMHSSTRSEKKFRTHDLSLGSIDVSPIHSGANSPINEQAPAEITWNESQLAAEPSIVVDDSLLVEEVDVTEAAEIDSILDADVSSSSAMLMLTRQDLIRKGEEAVQQLKQLLNSPGWKSETKHRSGVQIWTKRVEGDKMPIYRGDKTIEGFSPAEVMAVARHKKLWDEWYDRGNLVENLDDSTSLTSMVMKAHVPSTKPRDLVLVERLEEHPNVLLFASTSVNTDLCPPVPGRIRAHLRLNGWRLESCIGNTGQLSTKVTYVLHTHIGGNAPRVLQKKVLIRRPLVIYAIEQYLHQHGPPSMKLLDLDGDSESPDSSDLDLLSNRVSMMPSAGHGDILAYAQQKSEEVTSISNGTSSVKERKLSSVINEDPVDKASQASSTPEKKKSSLSVASLKVNSSSDEKPSSRGNLQVSFVEPDNPDKITRPRQDTTASPVEAVTIPRLSFDLSNYTAELPEVTPTEELTIVSTESTLIDSQQHSANTTITTTTTTITEEKEEEKEQDMSKTHLPATTSRPSSQLSRRQSATPTPQVPTHRHADAIIAARDLTNQLLPLDLWQLQLEQRGVSIYKHQLPNKPMPAVRGDIVIKGWTIEEVMSVIRSLECRKYWDERFDGGQVIEWLDARTVLAHTAVKGVFPVSGRDFSAISEVRNDPESQTLQAIAVSVEDPSVPVQPKRVRAQLDIASWILKTDADEPTTVHVTYITQFDPCGSLPSSLVKAVQTQTPMCVAKIADFLTKYAPPPSISRTTLGRDDEKYDAAKSTWSATFKLDAAHAGQVRGAEVLVGRCTWSKSGYTITSQPTNAEIHRVEDGFRLVMREPGSVHISVKKHSNKEATGAVLFNGKPLASKQQGPSKSSSTTSLASGIISNAVNTPTKSSSTTVNSITNGQGILRSRAALASSNNGNHKKGHSTSSTTSVNTRQSVTFSSDTTTMTTTSLLDAANTTTTIPADSFFNDTSNMSGILLSRKTRSETIPSVPVRVIRWQRLTDGQVAFVALVAFLAFYMGLLYERYFISGFLAWFFFATTIVSHLFHNRRVFNGVKNDRFTPLYLSLSISLLFLV